MHLQGFVNCTLLLGAFMGIVCGFPLRSYFAAFTFPDNDYKCLYVLHC